MVASRAVMRHGPGIVVAEMTEAMQSHATSGDWERVEELAVKLRAAVMDVPENQRREALLAARRVLDEVQSLAQSARDDVTGRLSAIRRGQHAARAYAGKD